MFRNLLIYKSSKYCWMAGTAEFSFIKMQSCQLLLHGLLQHIIILSFHHVLLSISKLNYECKRTSTHLILPSYFVYPSSLPFYIVYLKFIVDIVSAQKQNYGWDVTRKLIMLCIKALLITFTWAFESNSVYSIHFYYSQTLLAHILLMYLFSDGTYFASHQYTRP